MVDHKIRDGYIWNCLRIKILKKVKIPWIWFLGSLGKGLLCLMFVLQLHVYMSFVIIIAKLWILGPVFIHYFLYLIVKLLLSFSLSLELVSLFLKFEIIKKLVNSSRFNLFWLCWRSSVFVNIFAVSQGSFLYYWEKGNSKSVYIINSLRFFKMFASFISFMASAK